MGSRIDFLKFLETDVGLNILTRLDTPSDLVRVSAVSHYWRQFVITNGLLKDLCMRIFPQLSSSSHLIISKSGMVNNTVNVKSSNHTEMEVLEMDHKAYASLLEALSRTEVSQKDCIANAVRASSTDRDPYESIDNTLHSRSRSRWGSASYWSMYWDPNQPICSSKSVRFRMGYSKFQYMDIGTPDDNCLVWTYTSPEFPMKHENQLQKFKLPKPVLCIGGFLQIELLGRVERVELDGLFYICINYVRVLGLPLKPAFDIEILKPSGEFVLKCCPEALTSTLRHSFDDDSDVYLHPIEPAQMWENIYQQE